MAIDFILERTFPNLVEAVEFERNAAALRPEDAVEGNGEPFLIGPGNGPDGADNPRATRDEDPLAVSGIEGDRHIGEDRTGKLAAELGDQNGLQKRSFINPIPTGRIGRPVDDGCFGLGPQPCKRRGRAGRRRGLRGSGQFPVIEFGEQLEKLTGRRNGAFGCDTG